MAGEDTKKRKRIIIRTGNMSKPINLAIPLATPPNHRCRIFLVNLHCIIYILKRYLGKCRPKPYQIGAYFLLVSTALLEFQFYVAIIHISFFLLLLELCFRGKTSIFLLLHLSKLICIIYILAKKYAFASFFRMIFMTTNLFGYFNGLLRLFLGI